MFAGEIFIKSDLFDSVRFKGVSMFTDESMMPPNLRGYALKLPGCRLKRNGHLITKWPYHQPSKSAGGPFVIKDLSQSIMGTIDVTVARITVKKRNSSLRQPIFRFNP
ncbi:fimbria/pilus outer membrane usher protein [Providencia rettgeri]|uniref:Fimbria/pilus outer membrane usher protein n=1 Tax=Providencia rettgeri TaxID=587 RepID=A0A939SIX8_PRORE|nr:fimbria/pilus outer membrane usher protein [Providencia rettgeri]